jgi:hypothetical protein
MRSAVVCCLLLSACSSVAGPAGPVGPQGAPGDPAVLAMLATKIAALEAEIAAVKPVKVPWFVDGETKEPIGRVLDYSARLAWNDQIAAPLPAVPVAAYFAEPDCKGDARVAWTLAGTRHVSLADGRIVDVSPIRAPFVAASSLSPGRACAPQLDPQPDNLYPFTATGVMVNTTTPQRLSVEVR